MKTESNAFCSLCVEAEVKVVQTTKKSDLFQCVLCKVEIDSF